MATKFDKGTWRKWARRYYYFKKVLPPREWSNERLKDEVQSLELCKKHTYCQGLYLHARSAIVIFFISLWYDIRGLFLKAYALAYMWYLKKT